MVLSLETWFLQVWAPESAVPAHQSSADSVRWACPSAAAVTTVTSSVTAQTPQVTLRFSLTPGCRACSTRFLLVRNIWARILERPREESFGDHKAAGVYEVGQG